MAAKPPAPKYDANRFRPKVEKPAPSKGREALRARLAAARKASGEIVTVDLGDGEPAELEVRKPTAGEKWRIQQLGFEQTDGPDGEAKSVMLPAQFWPALIQAVYVLPGTDEHVWDEDEIREIAALDSDVVDSLAAPALKVMGWTKEARSELSGNSEAEATDDSSSTSPTA